MTDKTPAMPELPDGVTLEDLLIPLRAALSTCHDTDWSLRRFKTHITHALAALQSAQPTAAVSDEAERLLLQEFLDAYDSLLPSFDAEGWAERARAILALRPQVELDVRNTPFGKEAEKLADDHMALMAECAELREQLEALRPQAVPMTDAEKFEAFNTACIFEEDPAADAFYKGIEVAERKHGITQRADGGEVQA